MHKGIIMKFEKCSLFYRCNIYFEFT